MKTTQRVTQTSKALTVVILSCLSLFGCALIQGLANLPVQYVIASIEGDFRQDAFVSVRRSRSDNRQTWTANTLFTGSGPTVDPAHGSPSFTTIIFGRGGSSPGIGANGDIYVMAFWGRPSTTAVDATNVTMFAALSHDGFAWTVPTPVHTSPRVHSNASGIVGRAGISVVSVGVNGDWFAAYADDTGAIIIVPLPVTRSGDIDISISTTPVTVPGAATLRAPALSHFRGSLVLAWRVPGSSGEVRMLTTTNGRVWPPAAGATNPMIVDSSGVPTPLIIEDSAPFLHNSLGDLFLASTAFLPGTGAGRVRTHRSGDGATFMEVASFASNPLLEGAAAAGPLSELVVVYPTPNRINTTVFGSGIRERTIATGTNRRVTIANGPGQ